MDQVAEVFPYWCRDCGINTYLEYFTVWNDIWAETGLPPNGGHLCIGCVERRIGRRLTKDDFPRTRNNRPDDHLSDRMLDRLGLLLEFTDDEGNVLTREQAQPWIVDCDNPQP